MRDLLDTTVWVHFIRRRRDAVAYIAGLREQTYMSVITVAELCQVTRAGRELKLLEHAVRICEIVAIDDQIAINGGRYRRMYGRSHGTELTDALIAASVEAVGARLVTHNSRHFPMLTNVHVPY